MKDEIIIEDFIDNGVIELEERMHMPVLENLTIIPSEKQQVFKSKKDGFNEVVVEEVEGDELTIIPTTEEQINEGLFDKVIVEKVTSDIDKNIRPEIIREGEKILDVVGNYKGIDTSDATATSDDILKNKTAYVNGQKLDGTIEGYDGSFTGNATTVNELEVSFISSIDDSLGANCTKLPNGLKSIGKNAFYNCTYLALTELPEGITTILSYAFHHCDNLKLTKLPNGLKSIGGYAFYECYNLALTELPEGIEEIETDAFNGCKRIVIQKVPSGIKTIYNRTFQYCGMSELTLEGNIINMGNYIVRYCNNLVKFALPNITSIPTLGIEVFKNTPIEKGTGYIYLPDNLVEEAKIATNWSVWADQIKPISEMEV